VVARDVLELDPSVRELEAVGDPLLVPRDRHGAEVRREDEADGTSDSVLDHLADDVLDPRRPVAHAEVAAKVLPELGGERVDLTARDLEEGRSAADRAVALPDLVDHRTGRRTPAANVRQVARNLLERRRAAVGHDEDADPGAHDDVRARTCSTRRRTASGGVAGTSP
jgi:hypothetical protein